MSNTSLRADAAAPLVESRQLPMTRFPNALRVAIVAAGVFTLAGCGTLETRDTPDYRSATTRAPLEVPPGLKRRGGKGSLTVPDSGAADPNTLSRYESQRGDTGSVQEVPGRVLPEFDNMRLLRADDQRWLVVKSDPEELWPLVTDFWLKDRIRLVTENPGTGVMETDWLENYAEINTVARRWFRKVLGSIVTADSYDKFRVRLENGVESGTTEIYMSHRRIDAEELPKENSLDVISTKWVSSDSDPDLEAEMLRLLMIHLGVGEAEAERVVAEQAPARPDRARLESGGGQSRIMMNDNAQDAWRRVGIALDRIGFTVEDQDRQAGTFYVRTVDPKAAEKAGKSNWVGRLLRRDRADDVEFKSRIKIASRDSQSEVTILKDDGSPDSTEAGERILGLLLEELK